MLECLIGLLVLVLVGLYICLWNYVACKVFGFEGGTLLTLVGFPFILPIALVLVITFCYAIGTEVLWFLRR